MEKKDLIFSNILNAVKKYTVLSHYGGRRNSGS